MKTNFPLHWRKYRCTQYGAYSSFWVHFTLEENGTGANGYFSSHADSPIWIAPWNFFKMWKKQNRENTWSYQWTTYLIHDLLWEHFFLAQMVSWFCPLGLSVLIPDIPTTTNLGTVMHMVQAFCAQVRHNLRTALKTDLSYPYAWFNMYIQMSSVLSVPVKSAWVSKVTVDFLTKCAELV